jgi:hypothetical protein
MLLAALAFCLLAQDPAQTPQAGTKPATPTFAEVVKARFLEWDQDKNGELSAKEIDALCVAHRVRGEEAAAVAAIKRVVRSGKYELPPMSIAGLCKPVPSANASKQASAQSGKAAAASDKPAPAPTPVTPTPSDEARAADDADRRDSGEPSTVATTSKPAASGVAPAPALRKPNFQASYASGLKKIRNTKRALFVDDTPDIDACKQGPLGDCFFVSAVGAFAHRDPDALKRMLVAQEDGNVRARFGNGQTVIVSPLSDAELALSGSTGDEGLWLPVLEKAMGLLRQDANPEKYDTDTATDAIARGGSTASIVRILTGKTTERIALKKRPRSTKKDAAGNPVLEPSKPAGDYEALAARVRQAAQSAFSERRLVTCSTLQEAQPKGIAGKHAYAVLSYDAAADALHLWNPHGNTHVPKGAPGLEHGYLTKAGRFAIPVADFVRVFGSLVVETAVDLPKVGDAKPSSEPAAPQPNGGK